MPKSTMTPMDKPNILLITTDQQRFDTINLKTDPMDIFI